MYSILLPLDVQGGIKGGLDQPSRIPCVRSAPRPLTLREVDWPPPSPLLKEGGYVGVLR